MQPLRLLRCFRLLYSTETGLSETLKLVWKGMPTVSSGGSPLDVFQNPVGSPRTINSEDLPLYLLVPPVPSRSVLDIVMLTRHPQFVFHVLAPSILIASLLVVFAALTFHWKEREQLLS